MAENRIRIRIEPNEHVFICGQTRFGKSYLANKLLSGVRVRKLIVDIKADPTLQLAGAYVTDRVSEIEKAFKKHHTVVYQPSMPYDWDDVDHAFQTAYVLGNVVIYDDERGGWPRLLQRECLPWEAHCIMRGAFRNVTVWTTAQRPTSIPVHLKSEASHFFVFNLRNGVDRLNVSKYAGDEIRQVGRIAKYYFWYCGPGMSEPVLVPPIGSLKTVKGKKRK